MWIPRFWCGNNPRKLPVIHIEILPNPSLGNG